MDRGQPRINVFGKSGQVSTIRDSTGNISPPESCPQGRDAAGSGTRLALNADTFRSFIFFC
jgi:hypothetical protein